MAEATTFNDRVIRTADCSDLARIVAIELRANPFPWNEQQLKDSLRDHDVHIAEYANNSIQNKSQAFLISQQVMDEASLLHIAVDPIYQSQGMGRLLLTNWLEVLPDAILTVWLEVRQSNTVAQKLYRSCGFVKTGSRKNYYRHNFVDKNSSHENADIFCLNRKTT